MKGLQDIIIGWWIYLFKSLPKEARAKAEHCKNCKSKVFGTFEEFLPDYSLKEAIGFKCKECGCPLSTLLRSTKKCELGKF